MSNEEHLLKSEEPAREPKTGNPVEYLLMPFISLIDLLKIPVQKLTGESGYLVTGSVIILFLIAVALILQIPQEQVLPLLLIGIFLLLLVWLILYFTNARYKAIQRRLNAVNKDNQNLNKEIQEEFERYSSALENELLFLDNNIARLSSLSKKLNESEVDLIKDVNEIVNTLNYRKNNIQQKISYKLSQAKQGLERSESFGKGLDELRASKQSKSSSP
ncbi:hypothetical protein NUACC21_79820 [Scytonema sp. NUACC21]